MPDQPYVTFPGLAGNYISTPDVNLLDADTANMQQSVGGWVRISAGGSIENPSLSSDIESVFGDFTVKTVVLDDAVASLVQAGTVLGLLGSTEYTVICDIVLPDNGSSWRMRVREYAAGGFVFEEPSTAAPLPVGRSTLTTTITTQATTDEIRVWFERSADTGAANDSVYFDGYCLRTGSDASFVPSLRIVGDLDIRADITPRDVAAGWFVGSTYLSGTNRGFRMGSNTGSDFIIYFTNDGAAERTGQEVGVFVADTRYQIQATIQNSQVYDLIVNGTSIKTGSSGPGNAVYPFSGGPYEVSGRLAGTDRAFNGDGFSAELRDGIDGPIVAQFDAADVGGVL